MNISNDPYALISDNETTLNDLRKDALKMELKDLLELRISDYAFNKMIYVAREAFVIQMHAVESYWLLIGTKIVEDILIPKQIVSSASVRVPINNLRTIQKRIREEHLKILGWGHSHSNFGVFFSSTDKSNQNTIFNGTTNYILTSKDELIKYSFGSTFNIKGAKYGVLTYQKEYERIKNIEIPVKIIKSEKKFDPKNENLKLENKIH